MKALFYTGALIAALALGACQVHKTTEAHKAAPVEQKAFVEKPTLDSLNARVTSLEKSRAAARAAAKPRAPLVVVR